MREFESFHYFNLMKNIFSAYTNGNLDRLLVPIDSQGQRCGSDSVVRNKPYLLFFDLSKCADPLVPLNGCPTSQVCVEQCPTEDFYYDKSSCNAGTFNAIKAKLICKGDKGIIQNCAQLDDSIETEYCARWYMKSESCEYLNRYMASNGFVCF
jgi:solute carrier family 44 (choline transporter-like protein), member 2/4/5